MEPILSRIEALLLPLLEEDKDMFLVSIQIEPTNNIKIFLDADTGLNVARCAAINRTLNFQIEEQAFYPDNDYSVEVSSPGVDEPLVKERQFQKNIGRTVEFTLNNDTTVTGKMTSADADLIIIEEKIPKKKETKTVEIPRADIKKAVVQISF